MSETYDSALLTDRHDRTCFDCGSEPLNDWLVDHALRAQQAGSARTYVWTTAAGPAKVAAYFSLAPTEVVRDGLTRRQSSGFTTVPGYLLARLALDRSLHGRGPGGQLLIDALSRASNAAGIGGGRLVVVDAIDDDAAAFYRHHGFESVKGNPHRLVIKIATIRRFLNRH